MTDSLFYIALGILFLLCIIIYKILKRSYVLKRIKQNLALQWGKSPNNKYKDEDLKAISDYYNNLANIKKGIHFIDDITWNDLDMDNVFKRINNTQTSVGEEYLYSLLREPVFDEKLLKERDRLIKYFMDNPTEREKLQIILTAMGKNRFVGISNYFFDNIKISFKNIRYIMLSLGLLLSPLTIALNPALGALLMVAFFITNMFTYYRAKNEKEFYLEGLAYIVNMIKCSRDISNTHIPTISEYTDRLNERAGKIRSISINSFYAFFYQTNDIIFEPIKIMFLLELIAFGRLIQVLNKHHEDVRALYETVGFLESMISVASYRASLGLYVVPSMYVSNASNPPALFFNDAYHPLMSKPVPNSISMKRSILLTGSNASGKSTFLKVVAINAIFAQTICTCLAREYKSSFYMIFTSMALRDDLAGNDSYYIAEIKSLKRILDSLNNSIPLLCIIDEVLRGTNTIERIAASSEVLRSLGESNCTCFAATHDIELASILRGKYENYHFRESFEGDRISFEYKIHQGKSTTHNAIKLLRIMGYEDSIVDSAEAKAERFLQEGKWCNDMV